MEAVLEPYCIALGSGCAAAVYAAVLAIARYCTFEETSVVKSLGFIAPFLLLPASTVVAAHQAHVFGDGYKLAGVISCARLYKYAVHGNKYTPTNLTGKVYVITGANSGVGLETARALAGMGATVVLACRSQPRAEEAKRDIIATTRCSPNNLLCLPLDLCSLQSVRDFVSLFLKESLPLHCLINNAGLMLETRSVTKDGYETVFQANHLGHFLLTNLLLPHIQSNGRIVNVSSSLHHVPSQFECNDVMTKEKPYSMFPVYAQSKLANILFTKELARRYYLSYFLVSHATSLRAANSAVTVNALHPGIVMSNFTQHLHPLIRFGYWLCTPIMLIMQKVPAQGAYCSVIAAISPDLSDTSGAYLVHGEPASASPAADNEEHAKKLWELSEQLVKEKNT